MKRILTLGIISLVSILCSSLFSCDSISDHTIHGKHLTKKDLLKKGDLYYHDDHVFTGTLSSTYKDGQTKELIRYLNGKQSGDQESFYSNGETKTCFKYVNGKKHGSQKEWWLSGNLKNWENYESGRKHGYFRTWFSNGNLRIKNKYEYNSLIESHEWDEMGAKIK